MPRNSFNQDYTRHYCTDQRWMPEMDEIAKILYNNVNMNDDDLKDKIILDIGANQGLISLPLSKLFSNSVIHSFEPVPENYNLLLKNIEMNKIENVIVHKFGFHEKAGTCVMCVPHIDRFKLGNTGTYTAIFDEENISKVQVDMKNFSTYLENNKEMCDKIVGIKVDAEGCEKFIITSESLKQLKNLKVIIYERIDKPGRKQSYLEEHSKMYEDVVGSGLSEISLKPNRRARNNRTMSRIAMINRLFVR